MNEQTINVDSNIENCAGYKKLLTAVESDEKDHSDHEYRKHLQWIVDRANHYAEKTGIPITDILNHWESKRDYWYMNYYQDRKFPLLTSDNVKIFDTVEEAIKYIGNSGFRCPHCGGVSKSPYVCDSGIIVNKEECDWKSYGLFGTLGKGVMLFVKEKMIPQEIFMPITWEKKD